MRGNLDLGLANRVALVAGGSSGLGFAVAEELAKEGADVAIGARDPERLARAERALTNVARGRIHATSVDLRDSGAVKRWVDDVANRMGGPHIVVTNSAGPPIGPPTAFTLDDYREALDTVLLSAIGLALTALPYMKQARWGRLLFIASETVCRPVSRLALSGVARTGILRFAQALVPELADCGITVNVLAPAYLRTPPVDRAAAELAAGGDVEAQVRAMADHIPLGRVGRPEEFGAVAAFLASERASFVTGTVQLVDGGASVASGQPNHLTRASKRSFV